MDTAYKIPLTERINVRMILFFGVLIFLLGWPVYTFLSESLTHGIHNRGDYKEVDLKAMGNWQMDANTATLTSVPPEYRALDGQKVMLEGQVFAPREAGPKVTEFQLVYSIAICCMGGPPQVQERVFAYVQPGKKFIYAGNVTHRVVGTLHVTMRRTLLGDGTPGPVDEVYRMDVDSVEPKS